MNILQPNELDYSGPVQIAEGIHWVGFSDEKAGLHCHPYLIMEGSEAVLIDGGSRDDFSTVMLKILRTGADPRNIKRLIYQHYDPDLCGNLPHFEAIINSPELKIISHRENNLFIKYYSSASPMQCIEDLNYSFTFSSGRKLEFIRTPFAHSPGSFITYDRQTKTLFSSDIFGGYDENWHLYLQLDDACAGCLPREICSQNGQQCPLYQIANFHQRVMTSSKALRYAMEQIEKLDIELIAPQHGSLIKSGQDCKIIIDLLKKLQPVGIDFYFQEMGQ
jgi:flavorubredoxin